MCISLSSKTKWLVILVGAIIIDLAASGSLLYLTYFKNSHEKPIQLLQFLFNFTRLTFDISLLCIVRIVLVVIATITAVNVGDEEKYVKNEEAKKLRKQTIQNSTDYVALDGFDEHKSNDFETIIKDPLGPGLQRGRATVLRQAKKLNVKQITKQRKNVVLGLCFVLCSACSIFTGIKCITFDFVGNGAESMIAAILLCTLPIWMNLQFFSMRNYANEAVKKKGRFFPGVHHHHLHLKDLPCNWCDLCHKRIQDKQGWRCNQCDFDVCNHCAMRSNKSGAEGLIRGDKGIKEQKEITSYRYFCRALGFTAKHTWLVAISFACLIITCGTNLILPHYTGRILDNVAEHHRSEFTENVTFYLVCAVSTGFFGSISSLAITIIGRKIAADIRERLFSNIMVQDISFFDGQMTGQLTSRLTNDTNGMVSPMRTLMNTILTNSIKFFGGLVMCLYTSWRLSILAFTSIGPIIFLITLYAQFSRGLNRQIWSALGDANQVATEAFSNVRTVRACGQDQTEISKYRGSIMNALSRGIVDAIAAAGTYAITNYVDLGASILILWYGGNVAMSEDGRLSVGSLISFQLYWQMINNAYQSLTGVFSSLTRAGAAATRVLTLMDNLPDIDLFKGDPVTDDTAFALEFKSVKFYYQMRPDNIVLKDFSLKIGQDKVVALVGRSGGGKSTVAHLLMR